MTISNTGTDEAHRARGEPTTGGRLRQQQETSHETCHDGSRIRRGLAADDTYARDEIGDQIWKLVRSQLYHKRWLLPFLEDLVQETESLLQEWGLGPIRHKFSRQYLGDAEYVTVKNAVFRAIETALDRLRQRHKVEVRPGSIWFDPSRSKAGRRQRRELPRNEFLGDDDHFIPDGTASGSGALETSLDIGNALEALSPIARAIVLRKTQLEETWESISADLGIPVSRVKVLYKSAIARLTALLESYRECGTVDAPSAKGA